MKLELHSGRVIAMTGIRQSLTYRGLLAGLPTRELNERHIKQELDEARKDVPEGHDPLLLQPTPTVTGKKVRGTDEQEERLPRVTCIAAFDSGPLQRDESEPYSSAVLVWYQDEFGLPNEVTIARIRAVDWEVIAWNWCW